MYSSLFYVPILDVLYFLALDRMNTAIQKLDIDVYHC